MMTRKSRVHTLWIGNNNHSEIKLKGDGGYVIAPTSLHESGNRYEFVNKVQPVTLTREQLFMLTTAFDKNANAGMHITNGVEVRSNTYGNLASSKRSIFRSLEDSEVNRVVSLLKESYREGYRDEFIFGLSGLLFKSKVGLTSAKRVYWLYAIVHTTKRKASRIQVLQSTYMKGLDGVEIIGTATSIRSINASL